MENFDDSMPCTQVEKTCHTEIYFKKNENWRKKNNMLFDESSGFSVPSSIYFAANSIYFCIHSQIASKFMVRNFIQYSSFSIYIQYKNTIMRNLMCKSHRWQNCSFLTCLLESFRWLLILKLQLCWHNFKVICFN